MSARAARPAPWARSWGRLAAAAVLLSCLALPISTRAEPPAKEPSTAQSLVQGTLTTKRFRLVYTRRSEASARQLAARIEQVRDQFVRVLGRDWPGVTEIRVGMGRSEYEALALPGGAPPPWAVALAYPEKDVMLLDALSLLRPDGEVTLRHELSHVALGQLGAGWPRWFQEGLAMLLTGDRFSITQYTALFRAVTQDRLFHFSDLDQGWPERPDDVEIAYAQSAAFVQWISDRYGPTGLGTLLDHVRGGAPFEVAFARALHASVSVEETDFRASLPHRYSWTPIVTGSSVLWGTLALGMVWAYFRRRREKAIRFEQMRQEDLAEDAAQNLARAARLPVGLDDPNATGWEGFPGWAEDDDPNTPAAEDAPTDPFGRVDPSFEEGAGESAESSTADDEPSDATDPSDPAGRHKRVLH